MASRWLAVVSLMVAAACARSEGTADAGSPAVEAAVPSAAEDAGGWEVTDARLQQFLAYQERTVGLAAALLEALARLEKADAGAGSPEAVALLREHADAQDRVRRDVGLSDRDVHELERIVGDVLSRRAAAATEEQAASLGRMEELAGQLPDDERAEFERSVAALKLKLKGSNPLLEERRKYGDANVDRVLAREAALTRQWNRAISIFAGTQPEPEPALRDAGR